MGLFPGKKPPLLGIDISPTAIKLLEISQHRGGHYRVECYAAEPLPNGAVIENRITDIRATGLVIRRALHQSGTKTRRAAIAVSGSSVITKTIQMPQGLSERELENMLALEAGQYIPFPIEDVNIDFAVLGPSRVADKVDVFLAASRSNTVNERVAALEEAGLQTDIVDLESLATQRACQKVLSKSMHQTIAVLDMGAQVSMLYVMRGNRLVYSREQDFGGQQLTDEIQQHYGLSASAAEKAKRQNSLPQDYPSRILQPFKQKMARQAHRAIQLYASANPDVHLDALVLAGGAALLPGAVQAVQAQMNMPVNLINPFHAMQTSNKAALAHMQRNAPAMLVAFGLALTNC